MRAFRKGSKYLFLQEKLDYMHNNPVERRLVSSSSEWPWSSWRFCYCEDASILRMDRLH